MARCRICKENPREYSWQPFGPDEPQRSFYAPGWHYRGFIAIPVCDECKRKIQSDLTKIPACDWSKYRISFMYKEWPYVYDHDTKSVVRSPF